VTRNGLIDSQLSLALPIPRPPTMPDNFSVTGCKRPRFLSPGTSDSPITAIFHTFTHGTVNRSHSDRTTRISKL